MKSLRLSLFFSLFFLFSSVFAQTEECATDRRHEQLMQNNPEYVLKIQENEVAIKQFIKNNPNSKSGSVYTIPVVVHVIHTGQAVGTGANISMTQINSAIDTLNGRYRNSLGTGVDAEIEFVLAKRDPNGNATTGVNRIDGSSVTNYATQGVNAGGGVGANEADVKALSRWPNTQYYNIWVVTEIEDNDGLYGIQGYAYFPGASVSIDGTIIMHTCFGTTGTVNSFNNMNRTLVHEIGHGLNLYHTFEGDNNGTTCPTGNGDEVADTDPHIRAASNCPTGTNSCTGGSIDGVTSNFMNYSSQTCAIKFTAGQKTRMRAAILASRPQLTTSLGAVSPGASVVAANCTPTTSNTNNGFGFGISRFEFSNVIVVSDNVINEGGYVDQTNHQLIEVQSGLSYPISINTGSANNEDISVFIDYNNNGDFTDAGENVFNSFNNISHTDTILIPTTGITLNSNLRMRVIGDWYSNTITGPCYNPTYGQTEDYALIIRSSVPSLSASVNTIDESCFGTNDGQASAIVVGGIAPYSYYWSTGATSSSSITGLASGSYSVTVIDSGSDTSVVGFSINSPTLINISTFSFPDSCLTGIGVAFANVNGGTAPYNYAWSNGSNTSTIGGLTSGTYSVSVIDNNGCINSDTVHVANFCSPTPMLPSPMNLRAVNVTSFSAQLLWDTIGAAVSYKIVYREVGSPNWTNSIFKGFNQGVKGIYLLTFGTSYEWKVQANFGGTWGPFSVLDTFTTLTSACNDATGYFEDKVSTSSARLNWTPNPSAFIQKLRFREVGNPTWTQFRISGTRNIYRINGLSGGTSYEWQVKTICTQGTAGSWGGIQTFNTSSGPRFARLKSIEENEGKNQFEVYPNPNNGTFNLSLGLTESTSLTIQVKDIHGRTVYNTVQQLAEGQKVLPIQLNSFASGIYFLRISDGNEVFQEKIIVE